MLDKEMTQAMGALMDKVVEPDKKRTESLLEELVERVFCARNASHLEHWATKSYSVHVALGEFYDAIVDKIDELVEVYQGAFGVQNLVCDYEDYCKGEAVKWIPEHVRWIYTNRDSICRKNTMLVNILEELLAIYTRTHYKLENLK